LVWGSYTGGFDPIIQNGITIKDNEIVALVERHTNDGIANSDSYQSNILGFKTSIFEIFFGKQLQY
jgi:hypothetical protein